MIPIRNRPGCFAVLCRPAALKIQQGYMNIFERGTIVVETITKNRIPLTEFDPQVRYVMVAIDPNGNLVVDS